MEETIEVYFDGVLVECHREEDRNGEYLFVAENGRFVKFPADADLDEAIERHNKANDKVPEVIEDVVYGEVTTFDADGKEVK